jgi:DNA-binding MarR family transcriptional regulator
LDRVGWIGYRVSEHGKVESRWQHCGTGKYVLGEDWRELRSAPGKGGYRLVSPSRDGKCRSIGVHRLVLLGFDGEPAPGEQVRHWDGNPQNNDLFNLMYGSVQDNADDRARHRRVPQGEDHPEAKLTNTQVREMRERYVASGRRLAMKQLAAEYDVDHSTVHKILCGKNWHDAGGPTHLAGEIGQSGERNHQAKLTDAQVREIRELYEAGVATAGELADMYGVSVVTVRAVLKGRQRGGAGGPTFPQRLSGKLTEEQVRLILVKHRDGLATISELASEFKVSKSMVWQIVKRVTWRNVKID